MNFALPSVNLLLRNNELNRVCKFIILMSFASPSVNLLFRNNELNRVCKFIIYK